eukprot:550073-Pleurochrysis_carterae.AAC.2
MQARTHDVAHYSSTQACRSGCQPIPEGKVANDSPLCRRSVHHRKSWGVEEGHRILLGHGAAAVAVGVAACRCRTHCPALQW